MENEKTLQILFNVQQFLGLWHKKVSRRHYICAVSFFYSIMLINIIPQLWSLSKVENVEEFIKVFFMLPSLGILVSKFITFLFFNDEIVNLITAINEMCNDSNFLPFKVAAMTKIYKLIYLDLFTLITTIPGSAIDSVITHETVLAFPKFWQQSEASFWICFAIERLSTFYVPLLLHSIDLLIFICIVFFDGFAKLNAARMRKLKLGNKMDLIEIIEFHIKLRK